MATVILVRHGRTTANATGVLAGRTKGVLLDEIGRTQAVSTGERLASVPLVGVGSSPLERCRETSDFILARQGMRANASGHSGENHPLDLTLEDDITECDYGQWQGRGLKQLSKEKLWSTVQSTPPRWCSLAESRWPACRHGRWRRSAATMLRSKNSHGPGAVWVAVSHGDIIKSVLADAFGMHLIFFSASTSARHRCRSSVMARVAPVFTR